MSSGRLSGNGPPPISGALTSSSSSPPPSSSSSSCLRKERRKKLRRSLSESIPSRIYSNSCSHSASLFTKQGRKGVNQDAMVVWENFGSKEDTTFCGVFDGHGPYGHFVAKRIRNSLPTKLSSAWELISKSKNMSSITRSNGEEDEDEEEHNELFSAWKDSFSKAFRLMDKELKLDPNIDCYCSGSTAVTLVKKGQDLVIGNVGDSRAVLGIRDGDNRYVAVQLTVDLKPNIPREAERIKRCKGRVFALRCEPEVSRVWLPSCDSPGLAMARAFGDFCLKDFGLISVPDIYHHRIADRDEFVVLATDGIWDVLSNEEVVEIVGSRLRATSAHAVAETAVRAWRSKFPSAKVDDCAVVCLFLKPSLNE